jgi:hypothetical protein
VDYEKDIKKTYQSASAVSFIDLKKKERVKNFSFTGI